MKCNRKITLNELKTKILFIEFLEKFLCPFFATVTFFVDKNVLVTD